MTDVREETTTLECSDTPSVVGFKSIWSSVKDVSVIALAGASTFFLWQMRNDGRAALALMRARRCAV